LFLFLGLACETTAFADIKVRVFNSSGGPITTLSQDNIASGAPISITLNSATGRIFIFDGDSIVPDMDIGPVTINGTTSASVLYVIIGNPPSATIPATPDLPLNQATPNASYARDFGGLTVTQTSERNMTVFAGQISRNVTGDIKVAKVRRLIAGGEIQAEVSGSSDTVGGGPGTADDFAVGRVQATSVTSAGRITASTATSGAAAAGIGVVSVGSLRGPVEAQNGRIKTVFASGAISLGTGGRIVARDGIDSVEAESIALSSVQVNGTSLGLGRVKTRTGGFTGGIIATELRDDVADPGIQIAGTMVGDMSFGSSGGSGRVRSPIIIGGMDSGATIRVATNVEANIAATTGTLGDLLITGSLGTSTSPVTITAVNGIGRIQAMSVNGSVTSAGAGVGAVAVAGLWTGTLDAASVPLDAGGVPALSVGGWSGGTLRLRSAVAASTTLRVGTVSSNAAVEFPGGFGGKLLIANSLSGSLSVPAGGLTGQVVINAGNSGGQWVGNVNVGNATLSPAPNYTNLPSSLGGGSVGVVRFGIHTTASTPSSPSPVPTAQLRAFHAGSAPIRIAYYGPITAQTGIDPATGRARVAARVFYGTGDPTNPEDIRSGSITEVTSKFNVTVSPTEPRVLLVEPAPGVPLRVPGSSPTRFNYETIPLSTSDTSRYVVVPNVPANPYWVYDPALDDAVLTANPGLLSAVQSFVIGNDAVPVDAASFQFRFTLDCNGNMVEDFVELTIVAGMGCLDCYNASTQTAGSDGILDVCQLNLTYGPTGNFRDNGVYRDCPSSCSGDCNSGYPADFSGDNGRTIDDIFLYLNAWFAGQRCAITDSARFNASPCNRPSIDDIFVFLNAWFGMCDCTLPQQLTPRKCPCIASTSNVLCLPIDDDDNTGPYGRCDSTLPPPPPACPP
jgi:hypothetical protein